MAAVAPHVPHPRRLGDRGAPGAEGRSTTPSAIDAGVVG